MPVFRLGRKYFSRNAIKTQLLLSKIIGSPKILDYMLRASDATFWKAKLVMYEQKRL